MGYVCHVLLKNVTACSCFGGCASEIAVIVVGYYYDPCGGMGCSDPSSRFKTIENRHSDIHQDHVRAHRVINCECLLSVATILDFCRTLRYSLPQKTANGRIVFYNQNCQYCSQPSDKRLARFRSLH